MNYKVIATGSTGNAVLINDIVLIDCGVPYKSISPYLKKIKIVLLTHSHTDHICESTIRRIAKDKPLIRFGCCEWMVPMLLECGVAKSKIDLFKIGKIYDYKLFKISPIKLYHDVPNCGYRLFVGDEKMIYATDTSHLQGISAKGYDLYLIEANYEEEELQKRIDQKIEAGEYAYEFRVRNTHLSKAQADEFIFNNCKEESIYEYLHIHIDRGGTENEQSDIYGFRI